MAISFTRVPLISPGDPVTSTQLSKFADGINDRLRSGLADGPWRVMFYVFSLFRQIRNSDSTGFLFPPQAEFFNAYQNIDPAELVWPMVEPGEPEGVNVANPMGAFVHGSEAGNLYSEELRVAGGYIDPEDGFVGVPLWLGNNPPETPEQIWELGKLQRGAFDPNSLYIASPVFKAATEHYKISPYLTSPHGNSWGGYMPAPERGTPCTDPELVNYLIFFTNLNDGSIQSYSGTCPEDPTGIITFTKGSRNYYVYKNDGTVDVLPLSDWIAGPFTGGAWVSKQSGEHIPRILNAFTADFRGTSDQRETQETWLQHAFDIQRFLQSQYLLAPQKGNLDEFGGGPVYPRWEATGHTRYSAGQTIFSIQSGESYYFTEGFVMAGGFVKLTGFAGSATIELLESGDVVKTIHAEADADGNYSEIFMLEAPGTPNPLSIRWGSDAQFTSSAGTLVIEVTELMEYKPELYDLYLCLRLGSCNTNLIGGMDGSGLFEESSNLISDNYFANGCITNINDAPGPAGVITEINTNAVFDSARRWSKAVRILPRHNLIGYEVNSDGKSVCYFRREGPGGQDLFDGIGPGREQVLTGGIEADKRYVVRSGVVTYRSTNYSTDQVFTGVYPTTEFQGDGTVFEYDGIYHTAPREGLTNEWLMGQQFKVYNTNDASIFKPEAYSDFWFLSERCHLDANVNSDLRWQFAFGESLIYHPESPTGWRYAAGSNRFICSEGDTDCEERRLNRFKSCRIYEPEPEIESATVLIEGGEEVIKLTFTGRFHAHEDAPASIDRDISTWDITALNSESYRTTENGIREYLSWSNYGKDCTPGGALNTGQQGNAAYNANIWGLLGADNPFGSCFPTFYFVKLFPKPYEDGNDSQNSHDTPLMADWWIQADLYLRAMCEGYVDQSTSVSLGCETLISALFDYTFESMCFEAFGGRWMNTLATTETDYLSRLELREDAPQGFGQLPNTLLSSEIYNQFASALNLLTRVRVMLPMQFQTRYIEGTLETPVTAQAPDGTVLNCTSSGGAVAGWWTGVPPDAPVTVVGPWTDDTSLLVGQGAGIATDSCDGTSWKVQTSRTTGEWRWNLADADSIYAIPEAWRDMVVENGRSLAVHTSITSEVRVAVADDIGDSELCQFLPGQWFDGTNYYKFNRREVASSVSCEVMSASGSFTGPSLGVNDLPIGRAPDDTSCAIGTQTDEDLVPILGNDTAFIEVPLV